MQVIQVELFGEMVEIEQTADGKFKRPEWLKEMHGRGNALAPKHEPILLFRKPRDGKTFAELAMQDGSGTLDIGSCRVSSTDFEPKERVGAAKIMEKRPWQERQSQEGRPRIIEGHVDGRWPPNTHFSHVPPTGLCDRCQGSGCDECHGRGVVGGCRRVGSKQIKGEGGRNITRNDGGWFGDGRQSKATKHHDADGHEQVADWACVEGCPILALDEMAGERPGSHDQIVNPREYKGMYGSTYKGKGYNDTGNASRFYPNHDWSLEIAERLAGETPFKYQAKASRGEREAGCNERPRKFLATMGDGIGEREHSEDEASAWVGNSHPTVKPISLIKWLASLCCPPPQFKPRLCVPFAGTSSEIIGAILSGGWAEIHGIERELEYIEISAARIAWWTKWAKLTGLNDPAEIRKLAQLAESKTAPHNDEQQTDLFGALGLE